MLESSIVPLAFFTCPEAEETGEAVEIEEASELFDEETHMSQPDFADLSAALPGPVQGSSLEYTDIHTQIDTHSRRHA
jgi:hypothetical protein